MNLLKNSAAILIRHIHSPLYRLRVKGIQEQILPWLSAGDRILDVGCGSGALGRMIMEAAFCPADVKVIGLEIIRQRNAQIPVHYYDGGNIPFPDHSFEVVILADVLHHVTYPHRLIDECIRVANRYLIIKDHKLDGFCAKFRISVMDWLSNIPYGIPCIYCYNRLQDWHRWYDYHGLVTVFEKYSVNFYSPIINFLLGGRIQYFAVLRAVQRE